MELKLWPDHKCASCGEPDLCEAEWIRFEEPNEKRMTSAYVEPICVECVNWYSDIREVYAPGHGDSEDADD